MNKSDGIKYKYVIWDFDGTLFNSYPMMVAAAKESLLLFGIDETADEIFTRLKISLKYSFDYYCSEYKITNKELTEAFNKNCLKYSDLYLKPFEGANEICRYVCDNGSKNYLYTHRGRSAAEFIKKFGMSEYFSDMITSENGFPRKPTPNALLWLTEKHGMDKAHALMVGDRDIDMRAAENAGINCCLFIADGDNSGIKSDYFIDKLINLKNII